MSSRFVGSLIVHAVESKATEDRSSFDSRTTYLYGTNYDQFKFVAPRRPRSWRKDHLEDQILGKL